jgi:hypothetical protein
MKKSQLLNFISRYHLAGATTSVKWEVPGNAGVRTRFITDDQNVIGETTFTTNELDAATSIDLGVYATPQLVKMLSAVSDDVAININHIDGKAISMAIKDMDMDMTFMLADLSVIRQVPDLKNTPDWHVTIDIDNTFTSKFIKAKNALPESENFGIRCSNNYVELVMNYSSINNNRISFSFDSADSSDMNTICFSSNLFKEILSANKDADSGTLEVSPAGLARVKFSKTGEYESTYYLVQLQAS